jgi:hypothetical protein
MDMSLGIAEIGIAEVSYNVDKSLWHQQPQ